MHLAMESAQCALLKEREKKAAAFFKLRSAEEMMRGPMCASFRLERGN